MIVTKTPQQIERMRRAGIALAEVHEELRTHILPGAVLKDLNELSERSIRARGAVPSFLGYRGYAYTICASVNEVVVHGFPDERALKEGDLFSVDMGLILDGWHADRAVTYPVGEVTAESERLLDVTEQSFWKGVEVCVVGNRLGDVSHAIQAHVEKAGFSVVREYSGHGIGRDMHEDPQVPNYGTPGRGAKIEEGLVLAIEPMVTAGSWETELKEDGWTVVTKDGSFAAHYEHTVAVTADGPIVLTAAE